MIIIDSLCIPALWTSSETVGNQQNLLCNNCSSLAKQDTQSVAIDNPSLSGTWHSSAPACFNLFLLILEYNEGLAL